MYVELVPIDFMNSGGFLVPVDEELHRRAQEYCKHNLDKPVVLTNYKKVWAICKFEDSGNYTIVGVVGFVMKPDISLCRVSDALSAQKAYKALFDRLQAFFADNGFRGQEALIYLDGKETEDQRCPGWEKALETYGCEPADRFAVKCR